MSEADQSTLTSTLITTMTDQRRRTQGEEHQELPSGAEIRHVRDEDGRGYYVYDEADLDTGEVRTRVLRPTDGVPARVGGPKVPRLWKQDRWVVWFSALFEEIAYNPLKPSSIRVFGIMLGWLDFQNWVVLVQRRIAEELDMSPATVCNALQELRERGIVMEVADDAEAQKLREDAGGGRLLSLGRGEQAYRLNPFLVWKGDMDRIDPARTWWESRRIADLAQYEADLEGGAD